MEFVNVYIKCKSCGFEHVIEKKALVDFKYCNKCGKEYNQYDITYKERV